MKRWTIYILAISILIYPMRLFAATGCSYPASLDSYADKQTGDFMTATDLNSRSCAIEKLEVRLNQVFNGIAGGNYITGTTAAAGGLFLRATSGNGVGQEFISFIGGNNGATAWGTLNQGKLLWGPTTGGVTGSAAGDVVLTNNHAYRFTQSSGTTSANFGVLGDSNNSVGVMMPATGNVAYMTWAGNVGLKFQWATAAQINFAGKAIDPAPSSGEAVLYQKDNGGKGQLCVKFPSGTAQCFASEP